MVRLDYIQDPLLGVVGWAEQPYSDVFMSEQLTSSESGLYFQLTHPLLTLENMESIAPDYKGVEISKYVSTDSYKKDNLVEQDGIMYKCKVDNTGEDLTDTAFWIKTSLFSEWLLDKTKASLQKLIFRLCNTKTTKGTLKNLCENKMLFDGTGNKNETVQNRKDFVGFEIVPVRSMGVSTKLNRISLQFTKKGNYTIYIFNSSEDAPVYTLELTKTKDNSSEWFTLNDIVLPYVTDGDAGGSWYLGYFQEDLPTDSLAIRKDRDWSKGPCKSCSRKEFIAWESWSKYLEVHPFKVSSEDVRDTTFSDDFNNDFSKEGIHLWNIENNMYDYSTNFGINLEVTVFCDISDIIISQRGLLADVIAKQVAVDMLRELVYNANVRTNRRSINASKVDILYELDGDSSSLKKSGLNYQLDKAYEALDLSLVGLDRVCLPCKNGGIKYRGI